VGKVAIKATFAIGTAGAPKAITRRPCLAPFGDWEVPKGFAKHGDAIDTQSAFRYSRYTRPLVTYLELQFSLGGYQYSIREDYNAEETPPVKEASIEVSRSADDDSAAQSVTLRCRQPVMGSLMTLEGVVPRSD